MWLCQYVDLCFHAPSLPCLHTLWHAIPTFLMFYFVFCFFYFLVSILFWCLIWKLMLISVTARPNSLRTLFAYSLACNSYIFNVFFLFFYFYFLVSILFWCLIWKLMLISVTARPNSLRRVFFQVYVQVNTTPELETALMGLV